MLANDTKIGKVVNNKKKIYLLYNGENCREKYFKFHKMLFNSVICNIMSRTSTIWKIDSESIVSEKDWMSPQITDQGQKQSYLTRSKDIPRMFLPRFLSVL